MSWHEDNRGIESTRGCRLNFHLGCDDLIRSARHCKAASSHGVNDPDSALHCLAELRRHLEYLEGNARRWNELAMADGHPLARRKALRAWEAGA